MSLDVSLRGPEREEEITCECCGATRKEMVSDDIYWANITHNLGIMADKAGIYKALWRPEEIGITKAEQLIEPLTIGLNDLKKRPDYFNQFNAANGWGMYSHFVPFVEQYLQACINNPDAFVSVSR